MVDGEALLQQGEKLAAKLVGDVGQFGDVFPRFVHTGVVQAIGSEVSVVVRVGDESVWDVCPCCDVS